MPGRQVRVEEAVVAAVRRHRAALGFPADAPDGVILSELAREAIQARLDARRQRDLAALYADWAQERDLIEDAGAAMRAAIEDGVA